jgi:NAD(P)-dependent dehydrogenase (short-subunit alcohol dehydrogenase family)
MNDSNDLQARELTGQVAVVTGASNGIGRGIALALAEAGADIVIADIDLQAGVETALQVEQFGRQARLVETDVRLETDLDRLVDVTLQVFKRIDILVNNAGINSPGGLLGISRQDIHRVFDTDLIGPFILTQRAAQEMVRLGIHGRMLCISSIHSVVAHYHPHYSASKAGLERLVIDAALELAPYGIRMNGIRPGGIMVRGDLELGNPANIVPAIPLGSRNGLPSEVADLALFLVSDRSRYITGTVVTIDGALSHQSYSALGTYEQLIAQQASLGIPPAPPGPFVVARPASRGGEGEEQV